MYFFKKKKRPDFYSFTSFLFLVFVSLSLPLSFPSLLARSCYPPFSLSLIDHS